MLLPREDVIRRLIAANAAVRVEFGAELGARPLVLPNGDFFPDVFTPDKRGAARLLSRMQHHAGMLDIPIHAVLTTDVPQASASGCSSGACAPSPASSGFVRLRDDGDEWQLMLAASELRHPVAVTTLIARSLSTVFIKETEKPGFRPPAPAEITTDLVAVNLGFGALLMEGAYVYSKSCGGPAVAQLTALSVSELALLVALFAAADRRSLRRAGGVLSTTQVAALDEARDWLEGNRELAAQLRDAPELLTSAAFVLGAPRSRLFSWFKKKQPDELEQALKALPSNTERNSARRTPEAQKADDDLKALVNEALRDNARPAS